MADTLNKLASAMLVQSVAAGTAAADGRRSRSLCEHRGMNLIEITALSWSPDPPRADQPLVIEVLASVDARIIFEVDLVLERDDGAVFHWSDAPVLLAEMRVSSKRRPGRRNQAGRELRTVGWKAGGPEGSPAS